MKNNKEYGNNDYDWKSLDMQPPGEAPIVGGLADRDKPKEAAGPDADNFFPVPVDNELRTIMGDDYTKVIEARRRAQANMILGVTPEHAIKYRLGRGGKLYPYTPHQWVEQQLNLIFGWKWSFTILETKWGDNHVIVHGRLAAMIGSEWFHKEQYGGSEIKRYSKDEYHNSGERKGEVKYRKGDIISPRDDASAAASLCITKCAAYFGIGADVHWQKEEMLMAFDEDAQAEAVKDYF